MANQNENSNSALEMLKLRIDFLKYVADALFKFLTLAFPILYMQWSNGTKLESIEVKADRNAVVAEKAVEKAAEKAAEKTAEEIRGGP